MTLMGWTDEQWAVAAGRHRGFPPTMDGALKLRAQWGLTSTANPLDVVIEGVEYPRDYEWVADMLNLMIHKVYTR